MSETLRTSFPTTIPSPPPSRPSGPSPYTPETLDHAPAAMTAIHPPVLPMPSMHALDGHRPSGFTDPLRYGTASGVVRRPLSVKTPGVQHERLPSVSQLLSPGRPPSRNDAADRPQQPGPAHGLPDARWPGPASAQRAAYPERVASPPAYADCRRCAGPQPPCPPRYADNHERPPTPTLRLPADRRPVSTRGAWHDAHVEPLGAAVALGRPHGDAPALTRRVVEERHVPGEGMCYVYEDGSHQRMFIGGEKVNAQWGQTKAGRPRKRMPVACIPCREKKIKCEPDESRVCVQCDKSGRECRYAQPARGRSGSTSPSRSQHARTPRSTDARSPRSHNGVHSPSSPPSSGHVGRGRARTFDVCGPCIGSTDPGRGSPSIVSTTSGGAPAAKRPRLGLLHEPGSPNCGSYLTAEPYGFGRSASVLSVEGGAARHDDTQSLYDAAEPTAADKARWTDIFMIEDRLRESPYARDPEGTAFYMDLYFSYVNASIYPLFPRDRFMRWLRRPSEKSRGELMVVYAMLGMGSVFSDRPEALHDTSVFIKIARLGLGRSCARHTLQVAQTRCILALYYFSTGDFVQGFDLGDSGTRAASSLRLEEPEGPAFATASGDDGDDGDYDDDDDDGNVTLDFGMNPDGLKELRGRASWWAFLIDRVFSFGMGHCMMMQKEDVFVRLPCRQDLYEDQARTSTPFFDNGVVDRHLTQAGPGDTPPDMTAYMIQAVSVCGDVLREAYRSGHRAVSDYRARYEGFYASVSQALAGWERSLPADMRAGRENVAAHVRRRTIGPFVAAHTAYHLAHIIVNRRIRHRLMPAGILERNIRVAHEHARALLHGLHLLAECTRSLGDAVVPCRPYTFAVPMVGYGILVAVDVLTAVGSLDPQTLTDTTRLLGAGLDVASQIGTFYLSARLQRNKMTRRIEDLDASVRTGLAGEGTRAWICRHALEDQGGDDVDLFYRDGAGQATLSALGIETKGNDVVIVG